MSDGGGGAKKSRWQDDSDDESDDVRRVRAFIPFFFCFILNCALNLIGPGGAAEEAEARQGSRSR